MNFIDPMEEVGPVGYHILGFFGTMGSASSGCESGTLHQAIRAGADMPNQTVSVEHRYKRNIKTQNSEKINFEHRNTA